MARLHDRILQLLEKGEALDDDELAARLGVIRQQVNQACRRLETQGIIRRAIGPRGKIVNERTGTITPRPTPPHQPDSRLITEDQVKQAIKDHLENDGYDVTVMWGRDRGIDIDARGPRGRLVLEAKGEVASQPQQTNYFLGALGELIQRMSDEEGGYGLALPDNSVYRGLVSRLPSLARERLRLRVFFVARDDQGFNVREA
jgi:biotin operon repressor